MDAGVTLGVAGVIVTIVAVIKSTFPTLPSRMIPVLVLALAALVVTVQAFSAGALRGDALFTLLVQIVMQTAAALGWREGVIAVVPAASNGPTRT